MGKNPPTNAGDMRDSGSIPASGRFPGGGSDNPLQYLAWKIPETREVWWAIVHGVSYSPTQLIVHGVSYSPTQLKDSTHKYKTMK